MDYEKIYEDKFEIDYIYELAPKIFIVANVNKKLPNERIQEWCAYIDIANDKNAWKRIRDRGAKLPKAIAEVIFPFSKTHSWRS